MAEHGKFGVRLGLLLSVVGVLLALPTLFPGYRLYVARLGPTAWPLVLINVLPLALFLLVGGLAVRRGFSPTRTTLWAALIYGTIQGLALYLFALWTPDKGVLARQLWSLYHSTHPYPVAHAETYVTSAVLHPSFLAYVATNALQMAVMGILMGFLGGLFTRRPVEKPAS